VIRLQYMGFYGILYSEKYGILPLEYYLPKRQNGVYYENETPERTADYR